MLSAVRLAARPGLTVAAVTCGQHGVRWSAPEGYAGYRLVLVRRGRFRRRVRGQVADLDPTVGYVGLPGDDEQFAHPAGGDVCTSVQIGPELWRSLTGVEEPALAGGGHALYVDARVDLAHRRLLRAARTGDVEHAVVERLVALLAETVRAAGVSPASGGVPATEVARAAGVAEADTLRAAGGARATTVVRAAGGYGSRDLALVARAREAIRADDPAAGGLLPLAAMLGVSPFRLSRAFSRHVGVPVTRYRNRVRVERALDRLEAGADDLAALAADLGFADQAHLCRTMRQHLGEPPSAVRRLLA